MQLLELKIYDAIPVGIENAITAKDLSSLFNVNERIVTRSIHNLRKNSFLITAVHSAEAQGYFKTTCFQDFSMFVRDISSRIYNMELARKPALDYITVKSTRSNITQPNATCNEYNYRIDL